MYGVGTKVGGAWISIFLSFLVHVEELLEGRETGSRSHLLLFLLTLLEPGDLGGTSPKLTALSQGQLPAGQGRSPESLPLPWHISAQRLCCTSQENGPLGQRGKCE